MKEHVWYDKLYNEFVIIEHHWLFAEWLKYSKRGRRIYLGEL